MNLQYLGYHICQKDSKEVFIPTEDDSSRLAA